MRRRKNNKIRLLIILLFGVTVGFAALSTTLKIDGFTSIVKNSWDIHFENVVVKSGSVDALVPASIDSSRSIVNFSVQFDKPGDFYEFTVDAVNRGSIDGMISNIETNVTKDGVSAVLPNYIKLDVTYADGSIIQPNDLLTVNDTHTYKIRVLYDKNLVTSSIINEMPSSGLSYSFEIKLNYIQADDRVFSDSIIPLNGDGTNLGDEVVYKDEHYFVLFSDNDKVTLMPKYNLKLENDVFKQDPTDIRYSSVNEFKFDEAYNRNDEYCSTPGLGCNVYESDERTSKDSTIKGYVTKYKQQLVASGMISNENSVRLINLEELGRLGYDVSDRTHPITVTSAPYFLYNTGSYWTSEEKEGSVWDVWYIIHEGELSYNCASASEVGLRPIIEVSKNKIRYATQGKYTYAVWMWDTKFNEIIDSETYMNNSAEFLKKMNVNEVYLSIDLDKLPLEKTKKYISKLNNAGIKVYALYGDPIFVMPDKYSSVIDYDMQCIANFNTDNLGIAHIEGIHYDVEYHGTKYDDVHTCPDGESEEAKNCVARRYFVQFVRTAYQKSRQLNLKVQFDITPYNSQFTSYYDENGNGPYNLLDSIIDYGDDFVLMSYGNGTRNTTSSLLQTGTVSHGDGSTITVNKSIVEKYNEHNKNIIIGQELEVFKNTAEELENDPSLGPIYLPEYEENGHTIYKYNKQFVTRVFNDIVNTIHRNNGRKVSIAVHDYAWFEDLYNN